AGLMGSGRSDILKTLFGAKRRTAGRVELDGKELKVAAPGDAIAAGLGFVPEDRKSKGLVLGMSLRENATLVHLDQYARLGVVNAAEEKRAVDGLIGQLRIRTRDGELDVKSLSGGNQQVRRADRQKAGRRPEGGQVHPGAAEPGPSVKPADRTSGRRLAAGVLPAGDAMRQRGRRKARGPVSPYCDYHFAFIAWSAS
ncbi:ATP-binding cassette domain-containing protein, partial (plasmid) [Chromobacterium amazonense]|uniref:ATP-binding cassette domain-containing protein n=1 Tax=Chromobacterium amazonense TaxID=1382803 RepID=UPI00237ED746